MDQNQKTTLRYSSPYLVFVVIPVVYIVLHDVRGPVEYGSLALLAGMVVLYLYLWLNNQAPPAGSQVGPKFWIPITLLVILLAAMTLLGGWTYPALAFMWAYVASAWVLLSPGAPLPWGATLILAAMTASSVWVGIPLYLLVSAVVVTVLTGGTLLISRNEIDKHRAEDGRRVAEHQLRLELERTEMNSDLHDILGQDLVGLSIKADLAARLLDAGRLAEASEEMSSVAALARSAMSDVRDVVANRREWSIDRELKNAQDLLAARGIAFHMEREATAFPGKKESDAARVIRESITNLLRHAEPSNCWVELTPAHLSIRNDGCTRTENLSEHFASGGLLELAQRVKTSGRLHWCQEGPDWTVTLDFENNGSTEPRA